MRVTLEEKIRFFSVEKLLPQLPVSRKNFLRWKKAEIAALQEWALRKGLMMSEVVSVRNCMLFSSGSGPGSCGIVLLLQQRGKFFSSLKLSISHLLFSLSYLIVHYVFKERTCGFAKYPPEASDGICNLVVISNPALGLKGLIAG